MAVKMAIVLHFCCCKPVIYACVHSIFTLPCHIYEDEQQNLGVFIHFQRSFHKLHFLNKQNVQESIKIKEGIW